MSIKKFIAESKKAVDGQILNQITNKIISVNAEPPTRVKRDDKEIILTALKGTSQDGIRTTLDLHLIFVLLDEFSRHDKSMSLRVRTHFYLN